MQHRSTPGATRSWLQPCVRRDRNRRLAAPERGFRDDALVLLTCDNGADLRHGLNTPLCGGKGSIWDGGFREPLITRWTGVPEHPHLRATFRGREYTAVRHAGPGSIVWQVEQSLRRLISRSIETNLMPFCRAH
ncbi:MAG: hypothetical protein ACOC37_02620 [Spirochaetota bacterium]